MDVAEIPAADTPVAPGLAAAAGTAPGRAAAPSTAASRAATAPIAEASTVAALDGGPPTGAPRVAEPAAGLPTVAAPAGGPPVSADTGGAGAQPPDRGVERVPPQAGRRGLVRSGALSMAALIALGLTRLIHGSLVSRATDRETYGLVGTLIAVTTIASLLLPAGVASAAARFIPYHLGRDDPATARAVHRFLTWLGAAGSAVLGVVAALGAAALFDLDTVDTLQVGLLCVAFSVYSVQKAVLYGFGEIPAYVRLELTSAVLAVAATVAVVAAGSRLYLVPLAGGYALFVAGSWWRLRGSVPRLCPTPPAPEPAGGAEPPGAGVGGAGRAGAEPGGPGKVDAGLRREILGYAALACLGTLSSMGFLQGTQLLANRFAAPAEVAYFAAAVTLVAPAYFLPRALSLVLFPAMARAHGAGELADVRRQADVSTRTLVVVLAPLFVAGILVAREVLVLFGGSGYLAGGEVLRLMLTATYLAVIQVAAVNALSSGEHVRVPVTFSVVGCLTGLAVVAALGRPLGATGIGLGYLLGTAVTALGPIGTVWRMHRMAWTAPMVRAVGAVVGALLTGYLLDGLELASGTRSAVDLAVAVAATLFALVLLRSELVALLPTSVADRARQVLPGAARAGGKKV